MTLNELFETYNLFTIIETPQLGGENDNRCLRIIARLHLLFNLLEKAEKNNEEVRRVIDYISDNSIRLDDMRDYMTRAEVRHPTYKNYIEKIKLIDRLPSLKYSAKQGIKNFKYTFKDSLIPIISYVTFYLSELLKNILSYITLSRPIVVLLNKLPLKKSELVLPALVVYLDREALKISLGINDINGNVFVKIAFVFDHIYRTIAKTLALMIGAVLVAPVALGALIYASYYSLSEKYKDKKEIANIRKKIDKISIDIEKEELELVNRPRCNEVDLANMHFIVSQNNLETLANEIKRRVRWPSSYYKENSYHFLLSLSQAFYSLSKKCPGVQNLWENLSDSDQSRLSETIRYLITAQGGSLYTEQNIVALLRRVKYIEDIKNYTSFLNYSWSKFFTQSNFEKILLNVNNLSVLYPIFHDIYFLKEFSSHSDYPSFNQEDFDSFFEKSTRCSNEINNYIASSFNILCRAGFENWRENLNFLYKYPLWSKKIYWVLKGCEIAGEKPRVNPDFIEIIESQIFYNQKLALCMGFHERESKRKTPSTLFAISKNTLFERKLISEIFQFIDSNPNADPNQQQSTSVKILKHF